jgi:26S proteasome regulatory subunit N8
MSSLQEVIVHPIVLLSVVDHYNRQAKSTNRRVIGAVLGEVYNNKVDVTNIYAIPFEEDPKNSKIWFVDHAYHETMFAMFKKVNINEKLVGWYSSGPKLRQNDIEIHQVFKKYMKNPVLVVVDVQMIDKIGTPVEAYYSTEEVNSDGQIEKKFIHIPATIGMAEVESIGVEHLIRDIKDVTMDSLAQQVH